MSLRLKIVLALMLLAAVTTTAVGAWSYISTRDELERLEDLEQQRAKDQEE